MLSVLVHIAAVFVWCVVWFPSLLILERLLVAFQAFVLRKSLKPSDHLSRNIFVGALSQFLATAAAIGAIRGAGYDPSVWLGVACACLWLGIPALGNPYFSAAKFGGCLGIFVAFYFFTDLGT